MKRTLTTISAAAALLVAAAPASAATTASGDSSVTADVADTLEATFPGAYGWGNLSAGTNESTEQVVNVKSNKSWGLKISSDLSDGKMKEWNSLDLYLLGGKTLTNPLNWRLTSLAGAAQSSTYAAISSTEALVTGGQPATSDTGTNVGVKYKQVVSFSDPPLGATNDYRIQAKYDASQGF